MSANVRILLLGQGKQRGKELAEFLTGLGYFPTAETWRGFSVDRGNHARADLILTDIDQPAAWAMADLAETVRLRWGESFPIVAMTAATKFQIVSGLLDDGANAVVAKKAPNALLEKKISHCLHESAPPSADELVTEVPVGLSEVFEDNHSLVRLGDVASVFPGATPRLPRYRRMAPPDQDWRGVVTSETLERFFVGKPTSYLSWNRFHLFRMPSPEEYSVAEKVLVRRAGPPVAAAVDRSRLPAGTDVYSIIPHEGIGAGYLACLLNSRLLDFYFNRLAGVGSDGRLRLEDLRETPLPAPDKGNARELARIAVLLSHFGPNPRSWIDRQSKEDLGERMEEVVFGLYGVRPEERERLESLHF